MERRRFTPDGALRFWRDERIRRAAVPGFDPVAIEGLQFVRVCPKCRTTRYTKGVRRDGSIYARCRRCGRERDAARVQVLRGRVQMPRCRPTTLELLADVEQCIEAVPEEVLRLYGAYVIGERSRLKTLEDLEALGWGPVSDRQLRNAIRGGRRELAWQLHRRDLLRGYIAEP